MNYEEISYLVMTNNLIFLAEFGQWSRIYLVAALIRPWIDYSIKYKFQPIIQWYSNGV